MANFRQFLAPSAHSGQNFVARLGSLEVGRGTYLHVDEQHLVVRGEFSLGAGEVDMTMDHLGPEGSCRVVFTPNGGRPTLHACEYKVDGIRLDIGFPIGWVGIQPEGQNITWVRYLGVWYNVQPVHVAAPAEGFPEAPAGAGVDAGEPATAAD